MSISEQVKELRTIANNLTIGHNMPISLAIERFREAADTIESLSAKLQAANEELERWHTDHINEKIKNPFAYTSTLICHNCDHKDDYIEELEAEVEELKAANMERLVEDCGGWIPCKDRLPTMEECQKNDCRFILDDGNRRYGGLFDYEKQCFTQFGFWRGLVEDKCAIAWQPLPDPYHEP